MSVLSRPVDRTSYTAKRVQWTLMTLIDRCAIPVASLMTRRLMAEDVFYFVISTNAMRIVVEFRGSSKSVETVRETGRFLRIKSHV